MRSFLFLAMESALRVWVAGRAPTLMPRHGLGYPGHQKPEHRSQKSAL
jgi:hypothetical protein